MKSSIMSEASQQQTEVGGIDIGLAGNGAVD